MGFEQQTYAGSALGGANMPQAPQAEMDVAIGRLSNEIHIYRKLAEELRQRLIPLLTPTPTATGSGSTLNAISTAAPLVQSVRDFAASLGAGNDEIRAILDRLAL